MFGVLLCPLSFGLALSWFNLAALFFGGVFGLALSFERCFFFATYLVGACAGRYFKMKRSTGWHE